MTRVDEVEVYGEREHLVCNSCQTGEMIYVENESKKMTYVPQFWHVCNKCAVGANLLEIYPKVTIKVREA